MHCQSSNVYGDEKTGVWNLSSPREEKKERVRMNCVLISNTLMYSNSFIYLDIGVIGSKRH